MCQSVLYVGLRVGVKGGGCSGFSYELALVEQKDVDPDWNVSEVDIPGVDPAKMKLKVYVDQMSAMYLEDVTIDYVEELDGSGFKFDNPNVKTVCGCGQSFSA